MDSFIDMHSSAPVSADDISRRFEALRAAHTPPAEQQVLMQRIAQAGMPPPFGRPLTPAEGAKVAAYAALAAELDVLAPVVAADAERLNAAIAVERKALEGQAQDVNALPHDVQALLAQRAAARAEAVGGAQ